MSTESLLAFVLAASVLAMTPGVDTVLVLRALLMQGRRAAAKAALGVALGCLFWAGAVAWGLGVLLQTSPGWFTALKWLGAAYLLWMGGRLLWRPRQAMETEGQGPVSATNQAFRSGLLTNLLNPKVGVFYLTFLPQFLPMGPTAKAWALGLAVLHVLLSLLWFASLIAVGVRLQHRMRQPSVLRALDRLSGLVFVAFGLRLLWSRPGV